METRFSYTTLSENAAVRKIMGENTGLIKIMLTLTCRNHLLTKHTRYMQDDLHGGLSLFAILFNTQPATVPFEARTHI
jgi:hypothetical protein